MSLDRRSSMFRRPSFRLSFRSSSRSEAVAMTTRDLQDFLQEAQLEHYSSALKNELKVTCIDHLKYVKEEDLEHIGMARPEMRRLKKFYKKECPQGTFGKLRKAIMRGGEGSGRQLSPSPPENRVSRPASCIRPTGKQMISHDSIAVNKTLGEGEFGVVQQGIWTTEDGEKVQVAIKCLSREKLQNGTQEFLKEASVQQSIDNENIVRLFGVVLDKENTLMLVTELAPMRSLLECLKEPSLRLDFPIPRLCDFAQQICDGMAYLESKRLIHRDLAARNILVFNKSRVKISDFGLSRALGVGKDYYQSNFSINLKLPIAWCAPECINYLKFTSSSDVWSYGVVLWEMFTYGWQPWAGLTGQQILEAIDTPDPQILEQPDLCPKEYYILMKKCWEHEPEDRPMFSQIFLRLPQIRPVLLKAVKSYPGVTLDKGHLYYKSYDIIVTLDKSPVDPPNPGMWKGAQNSGKYGFFDPTNSVPFIEPKTSPIWLPKTNLTRKESGRKSGRKIRSDMISRPQNDLRHTGHIGYDGAMFGDVSFIGEAYEKLPSRISGKCGDESVGSSMASIPGYTDHHDGYAGTNGFGHSWISQESLDSNALHGSDSGRHTPPYQDIDDDSLFSDFKIPDLTDTLDFGPSFMDEVLKALDEKEKKIESKQDKTPTNCETNGFEESCMLPDRRSQSPGGTDSKTSLPPLPMNPPRVEPRKSNHTEPKKQAKVKPMSASEAKMMESAIALANEFADKSNRSNMNCDSPPLSPTTKFEKVRSDSESSSDSTNIMSKLKLSMKRSPKTERKRTFSDDLDNKRDIDEQLPPEAQEAYNVLVVRGSRTEKESSPKRQTPERSSVSPRVSSISSESTVSARVASFSNDRSSVSPRSSSVSDKFTVSNSVPNNSETVNSASEMHISSPKPLPPKPVPRPRVEIKKSEIPVPRPRPEVHRVEPIRQVNIAKDVPKADIKVESSMSIPPSVAIEKKDSPPEKTKEREELKKTIEIVRDESPKIEDKVSEDSVNSSSSSRAESETKESESISSSLFADDFSEPSPREIMSKLARESRIRRTLDHHRGVTGMGDSSDVQPRSLREPSGIPVKTIPSPTNDDEEVDTNPLRMLRGGAIPIRGGSGAVGRRIVKR